MPTYMTAHTKAGSSCPGYINLSRDDDGSVIVTVRGDPVVREDGAYICGHSSDEGKPGRCTPGDENCNNYCNMAPQKGPMADAPKSCTQTIEGVTAVLRLSAEEWRSLSSEIAKGASSC